MDFLKLIYNNKVFTNKKDISRILKENNFYWLIDSEVSEAVIEIKNKTLIWHSGFYLSGDWYYGIFKSGHFFGNWLNGIFEDGYFNGVWNSGVNYQKNN
jgi:hypothetical protein